MSTRRSTRRGNAVAETEPPVVSKQATRDASPAIEAPVRKRGRKSKAAIAAETVAQSSQAQSQSQSRVSKASSLSTATATATTTTTTTATTVVSKRTTRAAKAAGNGSPLRVYQTPEKKRKRTRQQNASPTPEPTRSEPALDDGNNDDQGIFFSKSEPQLSSQFPLPPFSPSQDKGHSSPSPSPSPSHNDHISSLHSSPHNDHISSLHSSLSHGNDIHSPRPSFYGNDIHSPHPTYGNDIHSSAQGNEIQSLHDHNAASPSIGHDAAFTLENQALRDRIFQLEARVIELEKANHNLVNDNGRIIDTYDGLLDKISTLQREARQNNRPSRISSQTDASLFFDAESSHFPFSPDHQLSNHFNEPSSPMWSPRCTYSTPFVGANNYASDFDTQLLNLPTTVPARPMFVNSSESAIALLQKIENAALEPIHGEPSITEDGSSLSETDVTAEPVPEQPSTKRTYEQSATPARPISVPSSFFTRSFSAIKSIKSLFSTPAPKPTLPVAASFPVPSRTAPPPNSLTEALSAPPTPIGERIRTPVKKKKIDRMMRTLLKGVESADKLKAEDWVKEILPSLKNDPAFREKRKRLETPVLMMDLENFPSSKPWETGFGDPLADLDDEDVVPVWAVYLDIIAGEQEHVAKKHKATHRASMDSEDIPTIDEQYAASQGVGSSRSLFDSHGHSASELDFHPRRSVDPSPMFEISASHHQGGNVFKELQGHDTAAHIRTNDREVLQSATKNLSQSHNPGMGSFSVPDDSDEDDSSILSDAEDNNASPLWTQAPPPAPVPAHAPLPGGAAADAPSAASPEKPVDEIERQRQRLMKHTPAKPSRLREATYPSPSLFSDAGNESIMRPTPAHTAGIMAPIFGDMPTAERIELNDEEQADFEALVNSDQYKRQLAANPWPAAIITYDSDEEDLSPL